MKKCISIMLVTLMIITASISTATVAFAAADLWDGSTVAKAFEGGTGTESDPYLIATAAQLVFLRNIVNETDESYKTYYTQYGELQSGVVVNGTTKTHKRLSGKYFKLVNDIDMNSKNIDRGIGYSNDYTNTFTFAGNFDGDGHIIKNYILNPNKILLASGLFGLTEDATIKNLGIENAQISVNYNSTVCGYATLIGKAYSSLNLSNCYVKNSVVTITAEYKDAHEQVGLGIVTGSVGNDTSATDNKTYKIDNCYAVNNKIEYIYKAENAENITAAKFRRVSAFGRTAGYDIDINNCYAVNTTANKGLLVTNIVDQKFSLRTNYIFSCDVGTSNTGYTSKGSNCYVVGGKQVSAVDYLKQGEAFTIVASDELKTLPAALNSQNAYETKYADALNNGYPILKWEYERVCNPYKADNLKYTLNGSEVNAIQAGAVLTTADITKTTSIATGDKKGIFAYFDASGNLVTCALVDITDSSFDSAETVNFSVNMQLPAEDKFTGGSLRIFFWDDMSSLKPANRDVIIPQ